MNPLIVITIGLFSLVVACLALIVVLLRASKAKMNERDGIPTLGPEQIVRVDINQRQARRWERWHRSLEQ